MAATLIWGRTRRQRGLAGDSVHLRASKKQRTEGGARGKNVLAGHGHSHASPTRLPPTSESAVSPGIQSPSRGPPRSRSSPLIPFLFPTKLKERGGKWSSAPKGGPLRAGHSDSYLYIQSSVLETVPLNSRQSGFILKDSLLKFASRSHN